LLVCTCQWHQHGKIATPVMRLILQPFLTIAFWSRRRTSRELIPPWCEHPTVSWCSLALKSLMLGKWWQNCKDAQNSSIAELDMRIWKDTLDADDWWLMIDDCWLVIGDWWWWWWSSSSSPLLSCHFYHYWWMKDQVIPLTLNLRHLKPPSCHK